MAKKEGKFCSECGKELIAAATDEEKLTMIAIIIKGAGFKQGGHIATDHPNSDLSPGSVCPKCFAIVADAFEEIRDFLTEG